MTGRARNFRTANEQSFVEYASVDRARGECFYRLENGKIFRLTVAEARDVEPVRWVHLEDLAA